MSSSHALPTVILSVLLVAGCTREANQWQEQPTTPKPEAQAVTVEQPGTTKRIVLFAPLALGPLADIYPDARIEMPYKMALYIDTLAKDADGRVGESLPESGAPEWDAGRVSATRGAHLVVLTRVIELRREVGETDVHGPTQRQIAVIDLRMVDVDGRIVLNKQIKGESLVQRRAKFSGPPNEPESLATWQALSTGAGLVSNFLSSHQELRSVPKQDIPNAINQIDVVIDSDPAKADILVDGVFRGTTPQTIPLPPKEITLSIERQGYQPWSRKLTPQVGMKVEPALVPLTNGDNN
jgi:hypothetical protein